MIRVRVEAAKSGERISLEGEQFHYVVHVLRLGPGDKLELFDGLGNAYEAEIADISEARVLVKVGAPTARPVGVPIGIVQCLPKSDKLEWILQKGTELGVTCFAPAFSVRSSINLPPEKVGVRLRRWRRIVQEASRQSGRADLPNILEPQPLQQAVAGAIAALGGDALLLVLDEEERTRRLTEPLSDAPPQRPVVLVIGPEGGLDRGEVSALKALNGVPVTLGPRILRTETSPLAALAVILHVKGELG